VKVSAVIITLNEEINIARALRSVAWADEVLVIDSGSTDRTVEIAESIGARVIHRDWSGFSDQKQFGTDEAQHDWVVSLDADEEVSPELRSEIASIGDLTKYAGFRIPRLSFYMGRAIRHSGWYPDLQLRLFDRRQARWNGAVIHESVSATGPVGRLRSDIHHFSVENAAHHHRMIGERYAPLAAKQMFDAGRRTGPLRIAFAGPAAFIRSYILKLGFLDGLAGFVIARFAAHHAFLKHLMLHEIQKLGAPNSAE